MRHLILLFSLFLFSIIVQAHNNYQKEHWIIESEENVQSRVSWTPDGVADIVATKGLTLWHKKKFSGNVTIEYDARILFNPQNTVTDNPAKEYQSKDINRLSDLNCFWMATDPATKDGSVLRNAKNRKGVFVNQYALSLYYLGYGGNHNKTTRFRRYDGDSRGITKASYRPQVLREYTDSKHLLLPNHWYHIKIQQIDGHARYYIDGECIVDYVDTNPLTEGYFGFRTTLAHAQIKNFTYSETPLMSPIHIDWIGTKTNAIPLPQTFGVPFAQGEVLPNQNFSLTNNAGISIPFDTWTLASWPDGSVKWKAFSAVIPKETSFCNLSMIGQKHKNSQSNTARNVKYSSLDNLLARKEGNQIILSNGNSRLYIPISGPMVIDSILTSDNRTSGSTWIECNGKHLAAHHAEIEQNGNVRSCVRITGDNFTVRLYAYRGNDRIKVVHTLHVDSSLNASGIKSLGMRTHVAMHDPDYKRSVIFPLEQRIQNMDVKPLIARRPINMDEHGNPADSRSQKMIDAIASWDGFRLSQLSPNGFSIRKRATEKSPWIGTIEGHRAPGIVSIGDTHSSVSFAVKDFWQSYPSTIQVDGARTSEATVSLWLWSPESEPMSFEHYDTIAHTLEAAYEDVQEGMSTADGIARTTTLYIIPSSMPITQVGEHPMITIDEPYAMMPTPEYLHRKRAFGYWSLPEGNTVDQTIDSILHKMNIERERHSWYGYFNYGDVMHSYDASRDEWRYDVGGYAWDNTELGTNAMLWYGFLRSADPALWEMAEAMTRHTAEVDCYHSGPHASLGSRHNVSHWGCGAKEARISQAFWNRFYYYLTADERTGDLMTEVKDADQLLYTLDPMRLAQPRSLYPCTAPARLRVGPDWLAYAGNWFTEWERTGNKHYYDKIVAGMQSISSLPHGLFSGPKALGYDPSTGIITWEGDSTMQNTNHLLSIMGGFEMMNEMMLSFNIPSWNKVWLEHAMEYKHKALTISRNSFRIPRLQAYGYWQTGSLLHKQNAWDDLLKHTPFSDSQHFFTNDAATWVLDAIFMNEVAK